LAESATQKVYLVNVTIQLDQQFSTFGMQNKNKKHSKEAHFYLGVRKGGRQVQKG
jgi:hypothetical protein